MFTINTLKLFLYCEVNEAELNWSLILINFLMLTILHNYTKMSFFLV